jgi:thiamine pyrophosphate-dependent acetolactate synthase large subunit-like protein
VLRAVTKSATTPATVEDIPRVLRDALALARTPPFGPVGVEIPSDMMSTFIPPAALARLQASPPLPLPPMKAGNELRAARPSRPQPDAEYAECVRQEAFALCAAIDEVMLQALIVSDPGQCSALAAPLMRTHDVLLLPAVGFAIPTAIGGALVRARDAKEGEPPQPVVVFADVQTLLMTGPELTTAVTENLQLLLIVPTRAVSDAIASADDPQLLPMILIVGESHSRHADRVCLILIDRTGLRF